MKKFLLPAARLVLAAGVLSVAAPVPSASARACDWSTYWKVTTEPATRLATIKGDSIYNNTQDPITRTVTASTTRSYADTRSWEVGAEAGVSWKVVSAKISGKYGHASTTGISETVTRSDSMTIRVHYSGWMQINVWRKDYVASYRKVAPYCGDQLIARARWHDRFLNSSAVTRKGHVDW